jgi:RNA polymerase sigma-70 factor (ECF subfamily)
MAPELGVMYRDHAAAVWRYARSRLPTDADADDLTSDVFARALRSAARYDPTRGNPRMWLMGIARHAAADWYRRRAPEVPRAELPEPVAEEEPAADALRAEQRGDVRALLDHLSEREREAVGLRFGAELSAAEIGELLGTSATGARMLVHRAVTKLRGVVADG